MRQVRYPGADTPAFDAERPPEIRPSLAELTFDDEDILEGIGFSDPMPLTRRPLE
jgi:hypothetical protein